MVRATSAPARRRRKKRILKKAKGQFGHRSRRIQQAERSVIKGLTYAYRDRRVKKREFRNLWIIRVNAACRAEGISYSRFINGLNNADVEINRKMLAELAVNSPKAFKELVKVARQSPASGKKSSAKPAEAASA